MEAQDGASYVTCKESHIITCEKMKGQPMEFSPHFYPTSRLFSVRTTHVSLHIYVGIQQCFLYTRADVKPEKGSQSEIPWNIFHVHVFNG